MKTDTGLGEWVIRFRWWIILFTILIVAGGGKRREGSVQFSNNYRVFFSEENPQLQAFDALQNKYIKNDNAMIALVPKDGKVFTRETLAVVEELTKAAWQVPYSTRVDSVTNFQYTWAEGDDLVVEDLVEGAEKLSDADLERVKKIALKEPLLLNRLINPDAGVTAVNVTVNMPEKSILEVPEVANFVRRHGRRIPPQIPRHRFPSHRHRYDEQRVRRIEPDGHENAGADHVSPDHHRHGVVLRSICGTLVVVLVIAFSSMTAMGLGGWLGILLTPVSANAPFHYSHVGDCRQHPYSGDPVSRDAVGQIRNARRSSNR